MANGHGGYRTPSDPAPVSGPGALSRRTDGGPTQMKVTDVPYGEAQAFEQQQSAAPLHAAATSGPKPAPAAYAPAPFNAPTAMPDVPVTAGASVGAGPGMDALGLPAKGNVELRQTMGQWLPVLMRMADSSTSTPTFRRQVRDLIARINGAAG